MYGLVSSTYVLSSSSSCVLSTGVAIASNGGPHSNIFPPSENHHYHHHYHHNHCRIIITISSSLSSPHPQWGSLIIIWSSPKSSCGAHPHHHILQASPTTDIPTSSPNSPKSTAIQVDIHPFMLHHLHLQMPCYVFCICKLTYKWKSKIQIGWVWYSTTCVHHLILSLTMKYICSIRAL